MVFLRVFGLHNTQSSSCILGVYPEAFCNAEMHRISSAAASAIEANAGRQHVKFLQPRLRCKSRMVHIVSSVACVLVTLLIFQRGVGGYYCTGNRAFGVESDD